MLEFGVLGYSAAALAFFVLVLLLLISWRGKTQGGILLFATLITSIWAAVLAIQAAYQIVPVAWIWVAEVLRTLIWLFFLMRLLLPSTDQQGAYAKSLKVVRILVLSLSIFLIIPFDDLLLLNTEILYFNFGFDLRFFGQVLLALCGLLLVEQLFRNTPTDERWGIKYLCLGLGGIFVFDFYLFSDALLFRRIDGDIWYARGAVNALIVPLIAVASVRNPKWSVDLFVSRKMVFHTTSLFGAGTYMLLMAVAGYYIKLYGGEWGSILRITFIFAAGIALLAIFLSGSLRAKTKVFLNKHFFNYRYDYREEWLRLIKVLSGEEADRPLQERAIVALAGIVESPAGLLWLREDTGSYGNVACWNLLEAGLKGCSGLASLMAFFEQKQWVVNIEEYIENPSFYSNLELPDWLLELDRAWLLVPLSYDAKLQGFVLLATPRAKHSLNWENMDLLKTAGCQVASYLALNRAAMALAEAQQFEGFNRLSAFVIHDLKNLIAQLSLVTKNAVRHKNNPEFIDDAMHTIDNSVTKMSRLMAQMRSAIPGDSRSQIELNSMLHELIAERSNQNPAPTFNGVEEEIMIHADRDRMGAVFGHVIQNAQDATPPDGRVEVRLYSKSGQAVIEVHDTGLGMDDLFIKDRLFRPFDSTKGLTGMGIGAYECREFVNSIGGQVHVSSTPGKGTVFTMVLPLAAIAFTEKQKEIT